MHHFSIDFPTIFLYFFFQNDVLKNNLHNQNINIKKDEIFLNLENVPIRVSIIGRPNTGKSTLVNNIIGENRLVTGSESGITRDSIEIEWNYKKQILIPLQKLK